jgi:hypothetical protein
MEDKAFFQYSIQIFESYVFEHKAVNTEIFNEKFWEAAVERIQYALTQNHRIISLLKLVYINDQITKETLLNLLFSTTCKSKALLNKLINTPDEWGQKLYWPMYETDLVKVEDWANNDVIQLMVEALTLKSLTNTYNETPKDATYAEFPKTYKSLSRYFA